MESYKITPATFPGDKHAITGLFSAYAGALNLDLTFQDYESELNSLPGKYSSEKGGCLLVARRNSNNGKDDELLGCVAYRALSSPSLAANDSNTPAPTATISLDETAREKTYCEMKRLYLTPQARGSGIGTKLVEAIIEHAKSTGLYAGMKLDTLSSDYMASARALYKRYGFVEIDRYYETPLEGTVFMGLEF